MIGNLLELMDSSSGLDRRFNRAMVMTGILASGWILAITAGCGGAGTAAADLNVPGFVSADGINGGKSFDKFWSPQAGWSQTDANIAKFNAKSSFFRCKGCHGGDLLGREGVYISRNATASRPHISPKTLRYIVAESTPQQLFDAIKRPTNRRNLDFDLATYDPVNNYDEGDKMPNFGAIMSDAKIWELVKYLKTEAIDVSLLYDRQTSGEYPTGTIVYSNIGKDGDAAKGDVIYANKCGWCHGSDGGLIRLGSYGVGGFVRNRPDEAQHKIKFGQLGSTMGSIITKSSEMKDLYMAMANADKYP